MWCGLAGDAGQGLGAACWLDGGWGDWAWEFPRHLGFLTAVRFGRVPDTYQGGENLTLLGCWAGWIDRWVFGGDLWENRQGDQRYLCGTVELLAPLALLEILAFLDLLKA